MSINQNKYSRHNFFMNLALLQAKKNLGNTKENPSVGCVIVKDDCVISAGCTGIYGRPHAEQNAIKSSRFNVNNSSIYITLEPCSHFGKTPPCTNLIIKNKIKKVFFSIKDPDLRSYNKSIYIFKKKKIFVKSGLLKNDIENFYKSYFKFKKKSLPFVTAKMAVSKDFFTKNKKKEWITNNLSRSRAHLLRKNHDCIISSFKTVKSDNPRFTCRIAGLEKFSPVKIIIDKNLDIPINSNVIQTSKKKKTIIFYNRSNIKKIERLKKYKVKLVKTPVLNNGRFDLKKILLKVKYFGFSRILLETGLGLTTSFLKYDLIDSFKLFISSKKINNNGNKNFKNIINKFLSKKKKENVKVNLLGDKLINYRMK